jgi:hypothetical protein
LRQLPCVFLLYTHTLISAGGAVILLKCCISFKSALLSVFALKMRAIEGLILA